MNERHPKVEGHDCHPEGATASEGSPSEVMEREAVESGYFEWSTHTLTMCYGFSLVPRLLADPSVAVALSG